MKTEEHSDELSGANLTFQNRSKPWLTEGNLIKQINNWLKILNQVVNDVFL